MTVIEVLEKQKNLENIVMTSLEATKVLEVGTPEFDEAYGMYLGAKSSLAKIPDELASAKKAENSEAIKADSAAIASAVKELVAGLGLAEKLGEPVKSVVWTQGATGDDGIVPEPVVHVNPTVSVKSTGPKSARTPSTGRTVIGYPDGSQKSCTKFVLEFATEVEKATPEYKYPHTRVDSKPKFEAFCTAHNLSGFSYVTSAKAESEE